VVECLFRKCEALNSNPSSAKKKGRKKENALIQPQKRLSFNYLQIRLSFTEQSKSHAMLLWPRLEVNVIASGMPLFPLSMGDVISIPFPPITFSEGSSHFEKRVKTSVELWC
jgi:hypothetical protein